MKYKAGDYDEAIYAHDWTYVSSNLWKNDKKRIKMPDAANCQRFYFVASNKNSVYFQEKKSVDFKREEKNSCKEKTNVQRVVWFRNENCQRALSHACDDRRISLERIDACRILNCH